MLFETLQHVHMSHKGATSPTFMTSEWGFPWPAGRVLCGALGWLREPWLDEKRVLCTSLHIFAL